jgi:hypothetical protein
MFIANRYKLAKISGIHVFGMDSTKCELVEIGDVGESGTI